MVFEAEEGQKVPWTTKSTGRVLWDVTVVTSQIVQTLRAADESDDKPLWVDCLAVFNSGGFEIIYSQYI